MGRYQFVGSNLTCPGLGVDDLVYEFEVEQGMNDVHDAKCPKCARQAERVFGSPGIAFKGSGFHVNDYPKY